MAATSARLLRGNRKYLCYKVQVPTIRQRNWLRKRVAALGHMTVEDLVVKNCRNTKSRIFNQPFLERVRKCCPITRTFSFALPANLPYAILHDLSGFLRRQLSSVG